MDFDPFSAGNIQPDDPVGGIFLIGGDDFITRMKIQPQGDVGEGFGGVACEGHFIGTTAEQTGTGGSGLVQGLLQMGIVKGSLPGHGVGEMGDDPGGPLGDGGDASMVETDGGIVAFKFFLEWGRL